MKVASLISYSGLWNEGIIREMFSIREAEAILDIPLTRLGVHDSRFWVGTPNDMYSVKLGYLLETNSMSPPSNQSSDPLQSWWKTVWKLHILPKSEYLCGEQARMYSLRLQT